MSESTAIAKPSKREVFGDLVARAVPQLEDVLPDVLTPKRLAALVRAEGGRNPKLYECAPATVALSLMHAAELGLEPGGVQGLAYLIPRRNGKRGGQQECTLLIGYKGLCELARRSGQIVEMYAHPVYQNDEFSYSLGLQRDLQHKPTSGERGQVVGAYAVARMVGGGLAFEYMTKAEIDARRPKSATYGPWKDHYPAMARKTALRALLQGGTVPMSAEMRRAMEVDQPEDVRAVVDVAPPADQPDPFAMLGLAGPVEDEE